MDVKVTIGKTVYEYPSGITFEEISREHQKDYAEDIVLVMVNKRLRELHKTLTGDCELTFLTTADTAGQQAYRRSLTLLLMKAIYKVLGHDKVERAQVQYSLSNGYYCTLEGDLTLDEELLARIKAKMLEYVGKKLALQKRHVHTDEDRRSFPEGR